MKLIFEKSVAGRGCDILPENDVETVVLLSQQKPDDHIEEAMRHFQMI